MIDLEHLNLICAAFDLQPVLDQEQFNAKLTNLSLATAMAVLGAHDQIECRFQWYAEHCPNKLLPQEKRWIALAIAESYAARVKS